MDVLLEPFPARTEPLVELVYQKRSLARGPRIVAIGGGTGLSTLLRGLKQATSNITAVVTVADDGGSSGKLREELGIAPVGDIRNCITALADAEPTMTRLLQYRFPADEHGRGRARRPCLRQPAHRRAVGHRGRLRGGRPPVQPGPRGARPGGAGGARAADAPRGAGRRHHAGRPVADHALAGHPARLDQPRQGRGKRRRGRGDPLGGAHRARAGQPLHEPAAEPARAGHPLRAGGDAAACGCSSATSRRSPARPRATRSRSTWPRSTPTTSGRSSTSSSPTTTRGARQPADYPAAPVRIDMTAGGARHGS